MKTTIKDVAAASGVSVATVSRYLTKRGYVKPETQEQIARAIADTGYEYREGRKNSRAASPSVLVICGDISSQVYISYIRGIEERTGPKKFNTLIADTMYDHKREEDYLQYAIEHGFAGVIMLNVMAGKRIVGLIKSTGMPIVFLNRYIKALDMDIVCMDNYMNGYIATKHLIDSGHRRIAHLGGPQNSTACADRLRGYTDCLSENGIEFDGSLVFHGGLLENSGIEFAHYIMKNKPDVTAVYSANDFMAAAMVDVFMENGRNIPGDVSVVCTDNTPACVNGKVRLSSVSCDARLMGAAAGNLLIERIYHPAEKKKKVVYYPSLTERDSVKNM